VTSTGAAAGISQPCNGQQAELLLRAAHTQGVPLRGLALADLAPKRWPPAKVSLQFDSHCANSQRSRPNFTQFQLSTHFHLLSLFINNCHFLLTTKFNLSEKQCLKN